MFKRLQAKHRDELLAEEIKRLLAKRKQQYSNGHEDFQLNREQQAVLAEQAESRIFPKVLRRHRFYQFRLAFDKAQAKGSFKIMADELAEELEADIILPKSSVKPKYQGGVLRTIRSILGDRQAHSFGGSVLVGIRDVSRDLEFQSSYTLVEHAPDDSIELEIKAYRLCTSGGFRLPGFALADDGYLVLDDGQVFCSSDWIPKDRGIASVPFRHGLIVRYPIRMKEDLLPFESLSVDEILSLLAADLEKRGCRMSNQQAAAVVDEQLRLKGTLTLHSEAAARNGGDFDFDQVCVVEGDKFPRFLRDRVMYQEQHAAQKNKAPKPPSPWWNLPPVPIVARGNQIASIHG